MKERERVEKWAINESGGKKERKETQREVENIQSRQDLSSSVKWMCKGF